MPNVTANNSPMSFNFYRRYKWRAADFLNLQKFVTDIVNGVTEGLVGRAVLRGFEYVSSTGLNVTVDAGYGVSSSGFFMCQTPQSVVSCPAPAGVNMGVRHLVCLTPVVVESNYITNPVTPFQSVPLNNLYESQVVVYPGTSALEPDYPYASTGPNDVVLFGIALPPSGTTVSVEMIDENIRDRLGVLSELNQNVATRDDRCRPYRYSYNTLGIKPSQVYGGKTRGFTYVSQTAASIYPVTGGVFTQADSFYNFKTGAITGGDALSTPFTPTIPSAGNFILARVALNSSNSIQVTYGNQGTKAQCYTNGVVNQLQTGSGSVNPVAGTFAIAFVILGSADGTNITSMDVIDARAGFNYGAQPASSPTVQTKSSNYNIQTSDSLIRMSGTSTATLPDATTCTGSSFTIKNVDGSGNTVTVATTSSQTIDGGTTYSLPQQYQYLRVQSNGANWDIIGW